MYVDGMKASELIKVLEKMIKKYGDQEVYSGVTDYPEGVKGVYRRDHGDGYIPEGAFYL